MLIRIKTIDINIDKNLSYQEIDNLVSSSIFDIDLVTDSEWVKHRKIHTRSGTARVGSGSPGDSPSELSQDFYIEWYSLDARDEMEIHYIINVDTKIENWAGSQFISLYHIAHSYSRNFKIDQILKAYI
jgi:hypothetical protein